MASYTIPKRRAPPDNGYSVEQVLQTASYPSSVGLHIGQRYIPEQAPVDVGFRSGNEGCYYPHEILRTFQETTVLAVNPGFTQPPVLELVQAEWRQPIPQQQNNQYRHQHKVKRLQHHHHHHHHHQQQQQQQQQQHQQQQQQQQHQQRQTLKRRRGPQRSQYPLHLRQQVQRDNQRQHHIQEPHQQPYQHQLHQQNLYQQDIYHQQPSKQAFEFQNLQVYSQHQEQQIQPQRLHLSTDVPMAASFEEKSALSLHSSPDSNESCSPWVTPRVITRWLCFDSKSAYQPVPSTTAFEYGGSMSAIDAGPPLAVSSSLSSSQPSPLACDRDIFAQGGYLPNWAPMQPTQVTEIQPLLTKQEMFYPETSTSAYQGVEDTQQFQADGYRADYLSNPPVKSETSPRHSPNEDAQFIPQEDFGCLSVNQATRPNASATTATYSRPVAAKRGPFKDNEQRAKTALTRKMGSCVRCRMQRIRCVLDVDNQDGPCVACRKLFENSINMYRPSCARLKITDMKIFKHGQVRGFEWTMRWKDSVVDEIDTWESGETRMVEVTEGYTGMTITLAVRKFKPQKGDKLDRSWVSANGEMKKVSVPPYAIADMEAAATSLREYIRTGLEPCFESLLGPRDGLIYRTYALAQFRVHDPNPFVGPNERRLLAKTLSLWFSIRLSSKSFEIVGNDLLDMPRNIIDDDSSDLYGRVPIPPVLGAQLDSILLHQILAQQRRTVLDELSKMVHEKKANTWLTTYLVSFILLHNLALITKHDAAYAKKHGMNRRFARPEEVREYNVAAQTILHYYHYCNKGIYPFTADCKDFELQSLAELDQHGIDMVNLTRQSVAKQRARWESLWAEEKYEDEYYYLSQLYEAGWKARLMA